MKKLFYILKEIFHLVRKYKIYFLAPLLVILAFLALAVFYIGPSAIIAFIYAGI
ncbi:MAG: hypothetical protein PHQ84_01220 [Candidatus Omnitrophica bacterium]|nr:hypothetical protein [Candidatus Omnitrophota bacterium]MDD3274732.1 hypothetical protein [Candidatus Omnitrophota bacterium]MDD5077604.1 hypothetical protein [Candidatus Omnitrophota bacterium]MDD5724677.1 hypothetical protein [Candidatus Omnitrophota bacterium]